MLKTTVSTMASERLMVANGRVHDVLGRTWNAKFCSSTGATRESNSVNNFTAGH